MLNLVDKKVTHKVFGEGTILQQNELNVEVAFSNESKKFVFPDAFSQHLIIHNSEDAKVLGKMVQSKEQQLKEQELKLEEQRIIQREKEKLRLEYERITNNHKLHAESQLVFWCDEEEAVDTLNEWSIFTGVTKTGANKGKPNKAVRLHRNSAVLLTSRTASEQESDRGILGIYMVESGFVGKLCEDGNVAAHAKYRLQLTPEESKQLPFWKYYQNKKTPGKMTWSTGKYRYFENMWMAQILVDIVELKSDEAEKLKAQQFLNYFCKMNQIQQRELPKPNGALLH